MNKFLDVASFNIDATKLPEFLYSSDSIALLVAGIYPVSVPQVIWFSVEDKNFKYSNAAVFCSA